MTKNTLLDNRLLRYNAGLISELPDKVTMRDVCTHIKGVDALSPQFISELIPLITNSERLVAVIKAAPALANQLLFEYELKNLIIQAGWTIDVLRLSEVIVAAPDIVTDLLFKGGMRGLIKDSDGLVRVIKAAPALADKLLFYYYGLEELITDADDLIDVIETVPALADKLLFEYEMKDLVTTADDLIVVIETVPALADKLLFEYELKSLINVGHQLAGVIKAAPDIADKLLFEHGQVAKIGDSYVLLEVIEAVPDIADKLLFEHGQIAKIEGGGGLLLLRFIKAAPTLADRLLAGGTLKGLIKSADELVGVIKAASALAQNLTSDIDWVTSLIKSTDELVGVIKAAPALADNLTSDIDWVMSLIMNKNNLITVIKAAPNMTDILVESVKRSLINGVTDLIGDVTDLIGVIKEAPALAAELTLDIYWLKSLITHGYDLVDVIQAAPSLADNLTSSIDWVKGLIENGDELAYLIRSVPDLTIGLLSDKQSNVEYPDDECPGDKRSDDKRLRDLIVNCHQLTAIIEVAPADVLPLLSEHRYLLQSNAAILVYFEKFLSGYMQRGLDTEVTKPDSLPPVPLYRSLLGDFFKEVLQIEEQQPALPKLAERIIAGFLSEKFELKSFSSMKLLALALLLDPAQNGIFENQVADADYFNNIIDLYCSALDSSGSDTPPRVREVRDDAFQDMRDYIKASIESSVAPEEDSGGECKIEESEEPEESETLEESKTKIGALIDVINRLGSMINQSDKLRSDSWTLQLLEFLCCKYESMQVPADPLRDVDQRVGRIIDPFMQNANFRQDLERLSLTRFDRAAVETEEGGCGSDITDGVDAKFEEGEDESESESEATVAESLDVAGAWNYLYYCSQYSFTITDVYENYYHPMFAFLISDAFDVEHWESFHDWALSYESPRFTQKLFELDSLFNIDLDVPCDGTYPKLDWLTRVALQGDMGDSTFLKRFVGDFSLLHFERFNALDAGAHPDIEKIIIKISRLYIDCLLSGARNAEALLLSEESSHKDFIKKCFRTLSGDDLHGKLRGFVDAIEEGRLRRNVLSGDGYRTLRYNGASFFASSSPFVGSATSLLLAELESLAGLKSWLSVDDDQQGATSAVESGDLSMRRLTAP